MLFSFEDGDAKGSVIERRAQRPGRNIDLDQVSQVLKRRSCRCEMQVIKSHVEVDSQP